MQHTAPSLVRKVEWYWTRESTLEILLEREPLHHPNTLTGGVVSSRGNVVVILLEYELLHHPDAWTMNNFNVLMPKICYQQLTVWLAIWMVSWTVNWICSTRI